MTAILKWMRKSLYKLLKRDTSGRMASLERAAQLTTPTVIMVAHWTTEGAYSILVNGSEIARMKPLEAAQSKARVIEGVLRAKGYAVVLEG